MLKKDVIKAIEKIKNNWYIVEYDRKVKIICDDGILLVNAIDVNDNYIAQQETMPETLTASDFLAWLDYLQICLDIIKYQQIVIDNNLDTIAYKKINEYCDHETSYSEIKTLYEKLLTEYNLL